METVDTATTRAVLSLDLEDLETLVNLDWMEVDLTICELVLIVCEKIVAIWIVDSPTGKSSDRVLMCPPNGVK